MSLTVPSMRSITRKSDRRRNKKQTKKNKDFEICNPYRNDQCHKYFPMSLEKQLSQLNFLSRKNLQNIDFTLIVPHDKMDIELDNMRTVATQQQKEIQQFIINSQKKTQRLHQRQNYSNKICSIEFFDKHEEIENDLYSQVIHQSGNTNLLGDQYQEQKLKLYAHSMDQIYMRDDLENSMH